MKFIVPLIIAILILSSCEYKVAKALFPERPDAAFQLDLEKASPDFRLGWRDGCEVGMSSGTNTFYKMFYRNNIADGYRMVNSLDYKTAWGNAYWYCYRHDYVKQKSSIWGSMFKGYQ